MCGRLWRKGILGVQETSPPGRGGRFLMRCLRNVCAMFALRGPAFLPIPGPICVLCGRARLCSARSRFAKAGYEEPPRPAPAHRLSLTRIAPSNRTVVCQTRATSAGRGLLRAVCPARNTLAEPLIPRRAAGACRNRPAVRRRPHGRKTLAARKRPSGRKGPLARKRLSALKDCRPEVKLKNPPGPGMADSLESDRPRAQRPATGLRAAFRQSRRHGPWPDRVVVE